jgi:hypothetical protein
MTATDVLRLSIGRVRSRARLVLSARNACIGLGILAGLAIAAYHVDGAFVLDTRGRTISLTALAGVLLATVFAAVVAPRLKRLPDTVLASWIERRFPELAERLVSAVELNECPPPGVSQELTAHVTAEAAQAATGLDPARAVATHRLRGPAIFAVLALTALAAQWAIAPASFTTWLRRIMTPGADIPVWAMTILHVEPGDTVVARGDPIQIRILASGSRPAEATVYVRVGRGTWERKRLTRYVERQGTRRFDLTLPSVQTDATYYAQAHDGRSNTYRIRVEDRPVVRGTAVTLTYPAYMSRPSETREGAGADILAPVGSVAEIRITANKPLQSATAIAGGVRTPWTVEDTNARGKVTIMRDGTLTLALTDRRGFVSRPNAVFLFRAIPDKPPSARILKPARDLERSPVGSVAIEAAAADDYGIGAMVLKVAAPKQTRSSPLSPVAAPDRRSVRAGAALNLAGLGLKDGDIVTYRVEVRDTDNITGPHMAASAEYRIRIIGLNEMRERADADVRREAEALRRLVAQERRIEEQLRQARQTPERARAAAAEQRAVARQTEQLRREVAAATENMRVNGVADQGELAHRADLAAALRDLAAGSMPKAAASMERAAASPQTEMQTASSQAQAIRSELVRLADASGPPRSASELAREAAQIARRQMELADQTAARAETQQATGARAPDLSALAERQADLAERTRTLASRLEAAAQGSASEPAVRQAAAQFRSRQVPARQSKAARSIEAGKPEEAAAPQAESAAGLRQLASSLMAGQNASASPETLDRQAEALDKASDQLGDLANRQRVIQQAAERGPAREESAKIAGDERGLQSALGAVMPALASAPAAEDAARRAGGSMGRAAAALGENNAPQAVQPARQATRELLQAAIEARDAARLLEAQADALRSQRQFETLARDQRALQGRTKSAQASAGKDEKTIRERSEALAREQDQLINRTQQAINSVESATHKWMGWQAARRMDEARSSLWHHETGPSTQRYQANAAQTLERLAASLEQQRMAAAMQVEAGTRGSPESQMADVAGDVRAVREMQAQIRAETQQVESRRANRPGRVLNEQERRDVAYLASAEEEALGRLWEAAGRNGDAVGDTQELRGIAQRMGPIRDALRAQETTQPVQQRQSEVISALDAVLDRNSAELASSMRRTAPSGEGQRQQQRNASATPGARNAPLVELQPPSFRVPDPSRFRFGGLSAREQQLLQQGRLEKVPPEYRDLVSRYYRSLSERRR